MAGLSKEEAINYLTELLKAAPIKAGCGKRVNIEVFIEMYNKALLDSSYNIDTAYSKRVLYDIFQRWYDSRPNR